MSDAYQILKDFQPLLATAVALLAAALTYRSSTMKVKLDRELHDRQLERQRLNIVLRLRFAVVVMEKDANRFARNVRAITQMPLPPNSHREPLDTADWSFRTAAAIDEAWANLDVFPVHVSEKLSLLKAELFHFQLAKDRLADLGGAALEFRTKEGAELAIERSCLEIVKVGSELTSALKNLR